MHLLTVEDEKYMIAIDFVEITNEWDNQNHFFPLHILPVTMLSSIF